MTKEELKNILRMFETGNEYSGTRMVLAPDNLHVGVFQWDYYPGGHYYWQEPEYMESLEDEYTLLEIANQIEQAMARHSAYWYTVVEDLKDWYYWHKRVQEYQEEYDKLEYKIDNLMIGDDDLQDALQGLNDIQGQLDLYKQKLYEFTHNIK